PRTVVPAIELLSQSRQLALDEDGANVLPRCRRLVLAGGLAAAVGVAAVALVEPRAVPRAAAAAGRGAVRAGRPARLRWVLHGADGLRGPALQDAGCRAVGGHRARPPVAPPDDDDPPPDAVLGVHAVHRPVRLRDRGAGGAARQR